jgi:HlyD family secretion protein
VAAVDLKELRIEERPSRAAGRGIPIVLAVLLPVAFAGGWLLRGDGSMLGGAIPVRVEVAKSRRAGAAERAAALTEGGWIEVPSYYPIVVSALVGGRVEEVAVLEGTQVEKGQLIARLYAKDLKDALRNAEAQVAEAKAALDLFEAGYRKEEVRKAEAELQRVEEQAGLAEKVHARTKELVPTGAASQEDLERDAAELEVAKARVDAASEELNRLKAGYRVEEVAKARATLTRAEVARDLARSQLSYAEVRSPAAGVVLERFVTPGSWLSEKDPQVVTLYDPKDLQVRVDVRQANAGQVFVGQTAEVSTEAEPGKLYRGSVIRVDPLADLKKNTVQAKIRLSDPGPNLHPEMICRARFLPREAKATPGTAERRLMIPASAVLNEEGVSFVYLVEDGHASRVRVRLGSESNGRVEVEAGVSDGDRVILAPSAGLSDGCEVTEQP